MKIAYLILAHKNPAQLARLIRALTTQNTYFFIHVDAKVDMDIFSPLRSLVQIFWVKRTAIYWGGWSMVAATLELLQESGKLQCNRFHLLSGQDYPLRDNRNIEDYFGNDRIYMEYFSLPKEDWKDGGLDRFEQYHFVDQLSRSPRIIKSWARSFFKFYSYMQKRKMPCNLSPFGGSQWWSMTDECVNFIFEYLKNNKEIIPFFQKTLIPDEMFFQTIVMNSHLREKAINDNQRYVVWDRNPSPYIFHEGDIDELFDCKKYFARKFDEKVNSRVMELIDSARGER
jgi:hypothetical protein